jgi:gentisate 1,2-dioxygenase
MKMYKGRYNDKLPKYQPLAKWNRHGTTDDIGRWPVPGPECRQEPALFYHITEEKKLLNIHGTEYPMLIRFFVSNDLVHMGEFILPAGGTGCRASEPDCHNGDCVLFIEQGPITVFLTQTQEAYNVIPEEAMFIPEGVAYMLINYTNSTVKAIFSIAPDL